MTKVKQDLVRKAFGICNQQSKNFLKGKLKKGKVYNIDKQTMNSLIQYSIYNAISTCSQTYIKDLILNNPHIINSDILFGILKKQIEQHLKYPPSIEDIVFDSNFKDLTSLDKQYLTVIQSKEVNQHIYEKQILEDSLSKMPLNMIEIINLFKDGYSKKQIANKLNTGYQKINNFINNNQKYIKEMILEGKSDIKSVEISIEKESISLRNKNIRQSYNDGMSLQEMSKLYKLSQSRIYKIINK